MRKLLEETSQLGRETDRNNLEQEGNTVLGNSGELTTTSLPWALRAACCTDSSRLQVFSHTGLSDPLFLEVARRGTFIPTHQRRPRHGVWEQGAFVGPVCVLLGVFPSQQWGLGGMPPLLLGSDLHSHFLALTEAQAL